MALWEGITAGVLLAVMKNLLVDWQGQGAGSRHNVILSFRSVPRYVSVPSAHGDNGFLLDFLPLPRE